MHVRFTKFGGQRHWEFDAVRIGEDAFGVWVLLPEGTPISRPGITVINPVDAVSLFTPGAAAVPSFHRTEGALPEVTLSIYVDITTPPVWDGDTVGMLDLDLDVIQTLDGRVLVVDEDEFAENQVSYGYPEELIALARTSCDDVAAAMRARMEPYRSVGWSWLPQTPS